MARSNALTAAEEIRAEDLRPLVDRGEHGFMAAMFAIGTWGASTSFREGLLAASGFPLSGDLAAFLVINQLIYRGVASPTALADAIDTGRSNISKVVARLERHSLVIRIADPSDRRAVVVALTAEGRVVAQRIVDAALDRQSPPTSEWSSTDAADLERLLVKLATAMDSLPDHPLSTVAGIAFPPMSSS